MLVLVDLLARKIMVTMAKEIYINSALRLAPNFGASPLMVYFSIRQQEWRRVEDI